MLFIVAAEKFAHFSFDYLIKTLLKHYYHLQMINFRDIAYVIELNTASTSSSTALLVSYATAFAIRKLILMPSLPEPSPAAML